MGSEYIVVLITVPSKEVGEEITGELLEKRLAACVNIIPAMESHYWWQGAMQREDEFLLVAKSRADLFEEGIIPTVRENHPYEVPEIIALPVIMGLREYLDWIEEETGDE